MSDRSHSVPTYRRHKHSGQGVVTLSDGLGLRRDVFLGRYGSLASRQEYARVIFEWEASGRRLTSGTLVQSALTVNELILAFWKHAEVHYRHIDGTPTGELTEYRLSLRGLRELYGYKRAADFGPLALKAVRQRMVEAGLSRGVINQRVGRVRRMFKWAVSEELMPHAVYAGLATVTGLAKGRTPARETDPVKPVPEALVRAVQPFVLRPVAAMIELQLLTGMRPGEVCTIRACDLDTSGPIWVFRPRHHKTAWRGKERVVCLGPRAQAVLKPFLTLSTEAYLFSPARALAERTAELRSKRKTKVQPSQKCRRRAKPHRAPGERYTTCSYGYAIRRACQRAGVAGWHPNQLRHSHATEIRRRYGLEAAQVTLGHSKADVTQVYAERDLGLAVKIAAEVG
jgi:integrase